MSEYPPNRIKELRRQSRLTQTELGKLIDRSAMTVHRHENSIVGLDDVDIRDYARVFKVQSYEIFVKPPRLQQDETDFSWDL